jgi:hypothetical protein
MPRANRYFLPGYVWHIRHRCHQKQFLSSFRAIAAVIRTGSSKLRSASVCYGDIARSDPARPVFKTLTGR